MSSLGASSRKAGRSRSPNPPSGHARSSERASQDGSAPDATANTSRRAASMRPVTSTTEPTATTTKPTKPVVKPAWRPGGTATTSAVATRGRPVRKLCNLTHVVLSDIVYVFQFFSYDAFLPMLQDDAGERTPAVGPVAIIGPESATGVTAKADSAQPRGKAYFSWSAACSRCPPKRCTSPSLC